MTNDNRRMAYNIVRAQLNNLKNVDAREILYVVWKDAKKDVDTPMKNVCDQVDAVAFEVAELVEELRSELNEKQLLDGGL